MRTSWILAVAILGAGGPLVAQEPYPDVALPVPTGPHPVGVRTAIVVDSTRVERLAPDSGGPRVLKLRVWYPATDSAGPPVPYMDAPTAATWVERHEFPPGFEQHVRTHARADATPARGPTLWPLLLFSHGMSWPSDMYQAFFEDLASHGYVVAAVDHTGYADAIQFPDGRVVGFTAWSEPTESEEARRARLAVHMPTWVADLEAALDWIERRARAEDPLFRSLATDSVGVFGHSYGGGAATRLMEADPRVVAAANLEGSAYGPDTIPFRVSGPLLHVVGGYNEADLVATDFAPDHAPLYEVLVQGAFHSTFSDLIYLHAFKADDAWRTRHRYDLEPARAVRITEDFLLAFFDRYLRGIAGEREDLLHLRSWSDRQSAATRGYPEAEVRLDY